MADKPTIGHLDWVTDDDTDKFLAPSAAKRLQGWIKGEKPPFQYFNWAWRLIDRWLKWADQSVDELIVADATLQNNIDTEAVARANADTTLQNNIDALISRITYPSAYASNPAAIPITSIGSLVSLSVGNVTAGDKGIINGFSRPAAPSDGVIAGLQIYKTAGTAVVVIGSNPSGEGEASQARGGIDHAVGTPKLSIGAQFEVLQSGTLSITMDGTCLGETLNFSDNRLRLMWIYKQ